MGTLYSLAHNAPLPDLESVRIELAVPGDRSLGAGAHLRRGWSRVQRVQLHARPGRLDILLTRLEWSALSRSHIS